MNLISLYDAATGACIYSQQTRPFANDWPEIAEAIATRYGCTPDQVDEIGTEITAAGAVVAFTR